MEERNKRVKQQQMESKPVADLYKPKAIELEPSYKRENINEGNRTITKVTITIGDKVVVYSKYKYNWGGVYYFEDDRSISDEFFKLKTKE
jgi:hypothetical protein